MSLGKVKFVGLDITFPSVSFAAPSLCVTVTSAAPPAKLPKVPEGGVGSGVQSHQQAFVVQ